MHVTAELAEAAAQELADMNKRSAAQKRAKNAARVAEGRLEQEAAQDLNLRRPQSTYHVQAIPWLQGLGHVLSRVVQCMKTKKLLVSAHADDPTFLPHTDSTCTAAAASFAATVAGAPEA